MLTKDLVVDVNASYGCYGHRAFASLIGGIFVSAGREQPMVAGDVIGASSVPGVVTGSQVPIIQPEDDPRSAGTAGAEPHQPLVPARRRRHLPECASQLSSLS